MRLAATSRNATLHGRSSGTWHRTGCIPTWVSAHIGVARDHPQYAWRRNIASGSDGGRCGLFAFDAGRHGSGCSASSLCDARLKDPCGSPSTRRLCIRRPCPPIALSLPKRPGLQFSVRTASGGPPCGSTENMAGCNCATWRASGAMSLGIQAEGFAQRGAWQSPLGIRASPLNVGDLASKSSGRSRSDMVT